MDNTVEAVRGYYDENARLEWERLEKHPFEFRLTTGMMERYIRPGNSVLDIGGGPGRYSIHFAKRATGWCWRSSPRAMWPWPGKRRQRPG